MKLLLHICCAPCSVMCVQSLRAEGIEPTGYWYNPNIHPYEEYRNRKNTLVEYAKSIDLALEINNLYGLRPFTHAVAGNIAGRCATCYISRMRETARFAAEHGFTHFSTTLLYSPYQNHAQLCLAAEEAAQEFGVAFLYRDFRPLFRQGQEQARALGLYMQKYCGCVYSEEERYAKKYQKLAAKMHRAARLGENEPPVEEARQRETLRQAAAAFDAALLAEDAAYADALRTAEEQIAARQADAPAQ